jgi:lipopolysaccharide export system permease protein
VFRIADRYVLRQVLTPLATALSIGLLMLLAERMVRLLDTTLGKKNSFAVVFEMLAYLLPHYLGLAIPAALFLGLLFGFSRMSKASEVDAFLASGIGLHRLAQPVALLSLLFMVASILMVGWLQPHTRYLYRSVVFDVKNVDVFYLAEEGVFMQAGNRTFIIDRLDRKQNRFSRIFLFDDRGSDGGAETVTATHGELIDGGGNTRSPVLRLETGHRIDVKPWPDPESADAPPNAVVGDFASAETPLGRISDKAFRPRGNDERELTLPELFAQQDTPPKGATLNMMHAELHKRLINILTIPMLPFLAVPFALGRRRSQRAYRFGAALIILIVYYELIEQGAIATRSNGISPWLTMWLPFAAIVIFAAWRFWQACFVLGPDRFEPYFEKLARAGGAIKHFIARHEQIEERS